MIQRTTIRTVLLRVALLLSFALAAFPAVEPVQVAHAATTTLRLRVASARTEPRFNGGAGVLKGAPITAYKYIINVDNTGTTEQRIPGRRLWLLTADRRLSGALPLAVDRKRTSTRAPSTVRRSERR